MTRAITEIFGDTRHLSPALRSLTDALATAPNPAATARWLARPHIRGLLADIITGRLPLTHQAPAVGPDWHSAIYLRDLLASCDALPATDRQLADYEGWVHRRLASLASHPHERLLCQFSLWHRPGSPCAAHACDLNLLEVYREMAHTAVATLDADRRQTDVPVLDVLIPAQNTNGLDGLPAELELFYCLLGRRYGKPARRPDLATSVALRGRG